MISCSQDITPGRYVLPLRGLRAQVRAASGELLEQTMSQRTGNRIATSSSTARRIPYPARSAPALQGPLAEIQTAITRGNVADALAKATAWRRGEPGNVLALIGLGEAQEARRDLAAAARTSPEGGAVQALDQLLLARPDGLRHGAPADPEVRAGFTFADRPYVIMTDGAFVDLGSHP